ncbi:DUF2066 domain-containing protein [Vibrio parahaemolyticus]|uniref:DUF2066 domain-containing protein n=1 Tax=Vibrio parahaemolyticus TaxID=670 RepID=UPI001B823877|nr:DUF2066 domain-containing protein [Vibrio parahaemolyticus]MDF5206646.1 DUF2066 domain-containing protein [Vibrio parahaemolyticus]MDF5216566.1 DUF2066 domain-containing protein [Vibrio parahaemolyticus]HBC3414746.1 DUF2066 domain-containing protein [Vibrio parahaemolyticus]HBC3600119.1 DUF2066 domain-containing protein [Vibrio parahaemolyticus]HBC3876002.1 DUF2066 domain-containing protein [Vibrio parahaemolyticus]
MRYLALLLIGWLSLPVYALTQVDIYRAEVVIDSEQNDGESAAREQGMKDVIVRATGSQSSLSNPVIQKALSSSSHYISQLGKSQVDGKASLKMLFNSGQIQSLLTQAQLPSWSPNRANILVWLVEEQDYDRAIAWEHSDSVNVAALKKATEARGLPITIPVGDFDDVTGVNTSDLWGGFIEPISQASQRYPADAVLIIRAQGEQIRWTLYDQAPAKIIDAQTSPHSGSATGADAISAMVDGIADYYASKNAVVVSGKSSKAVNVKVLNVTSAADFFRLENALTKLNSVAGTEIKRVQGSELTLTIHLLASQQAFEQEASSISQLMEFEDPLGDVEEVTPSEEKSVETLPSEAQAVEGQPKTVVQAVEETVPAAQVQQPVVIPQVQDQYDLIYEWNSTSQS